MPVADPPVEAVGRGDGAATERAQWRLLELGFWLQEANGDYGLTTQQAVMAFQKYYGLAADGTLGPETAAMMSSVTERPRASADAGTLVEIDKSKQLLFFITDGHTEWILNTSTGSEIPYDEPDKNSPGERQIGDSVTRNGLHDVYRERAQGWWEGDLGKIYRPKYFSGGEAVHGSNSIPELSRLARLRARERAGDGLDLGLEPDADATSRSGSTARSPPSSDRVADALDAEPRCAREPDRGARERRP